MTTNIVLIIADGAGADVYDILNARFPQLLNKHFELMTIISNVTRDEKEIADSASGASAFACGARFNSGEISARHVNNNNKSSSSLKKYKTLMEVARNHGKQTCVLSTCRIDDATPAAFTAHCADRYEYNTINEQILKFKPDILSGVASTPKIMEELMNVYGLDGFNLDSSHKNTQGKQQVFDTPYCIISSNEHYASKRKCRFENIVDTSLQSLMSHKKKKGFVSMVEVSFIDVACHERRRADFIDEIDTLGHVINTVFKHINKKNTLVILTSDHRTGEVSITDNMNIKFKSDSHHGLSVPLFATGRGTNLFQNMIYKHQSDVGQLLHKIVKL